MAVLKVLGRISGPLGGTQTVSHSSTCKFSSVIHRNACRVVFAQHGYFTVAVNPTGSTTFGQGIYSIDVLRAQLTGHLSQSLQTLFKRTGEASRSLTC